MPSHAPTFVHLLRECSSDHESFHLYLDGWGGQQRLSHAELLNEAARLGQGMLSAGLQRGDRVALMLPMARQFCSSILGALLAGVVPVPMSPPMTIGRMNSWSSTAAAILRHCGARLLLADEELRHAIVPLAAQAPDLEGMTSPQALLQQAAQRGPVDLPEPNDFDSEDLALLQYTSGSTSAPKGVRISHRNLIANAQAIMADGLQADRSDRALSWLPLFHDMGLIGFVFAPFITHSSAIFMPTVAFLREPRSWLRALCEQRATITFAPNFAYALTAKRGRAEGISLASVRVWGCGAEPIHAPSLREFARTFEPSGMRGEGLFPCYGLAEATLAVSFPMLDEGLLSERIDADERELRGCAVPAADGIEVVACGRPLPGYELHIVDDQGRPRADRQIGEIVLRGPCVSTGYHEGDSFEHGLHTGDLGYLACGRLYVTGRNKDLLIINGRNVDPHHVEHLVGTLPGVRQGHVVAFTRSGTATEELVVAAEARTQDPKKLMQEIKRNVQAELGIALSDCVLLSSGQISKTSSGKLQRARTRQQYLEGTLSNRHANHEYPRSSEVNMS
jgi:fatty-acyl-CoA synthase